MPMLAATCFLTNCGLFPRFETRHGPSTSRTQDALWVAECLYNSVILGGFWVKTHSEQLKRR